jgi:hypothetical protein
MEQNRRTVRVFAHKSTSWKARTRMEWRKEAYYSQVQGWNARGMNAMARVPALLYSCANYTSEEI